MNILQIGFSHAVRFSWEAHLEKVMRRLEVERVQGNGVENAKYCTLTTGDVGAQAPVSLPQLCSVIAERLKKPELTELERLQLYLLRYEWIPLLGSKHAAEKSLDHARKYLGSLSTEQRRQVCAILAREYFRAGCYFEFLFWWMRAQLTRV